MEVGVGHEVDGTRAGVIWSLPWSGHTSGEGRAGVLFLQAGSDPVLRSSLHTSMASVVWTSLLSQPSQIHHLMIWNPAFLGNVSISTGQIYVPQRRWEDCLSGDSPKGQAENSRFTTQDKGCNPLDYCKLFLSPLLKQHWAECPAKAGCSVNTHWRNDYCSWFVINLGACLSEDMTSV